MPPPKTIVPGCLQDSPVSTKFKFLRRKTMGGKICCLCSYPLDSGRRNQDTHSSSNIKKTKKRINFNEISRLPWQKLAIYESTISSCISFGAISPGIESILCRSLSRWAAASSAYRSLLSCRTNQDTKAILISSKSQTNSFTRTRI